MGNKHCPPPQPIMIAPPQFRTKHRDKDIKAVRSVSNPSLVSQLEDEEEQIETSMSQQFTVEYMEMLFLKYQIRAGSEDFLPPDAVKAIINIFDTIAMDENVVYLAMQISESLMRNDDSWGGVFSSCADRNPLKYSEARSFLTDNRITMHAMIVFRSLKVFINALEEGNLPYVYNILDLIALSHSVMKVQPSMFRTYVVCMIKILLHYKIVSDEMLPVYVNFNMKLLYYIESRYEYWEEKHTQLLNQMFDGPTAPAREYYRELKKWKVYVQSCYKYLAKPLVSLEKQIKSAHKLVQSAPVETTNEESWKIIRCLKRGYKYKPESQ